VTTPGHLVRKTPTISDGICGATCPNPLCMGGCVKEADHGGEHRHYPHPWMVVRNLRTTHLGGHIWAEGVTTEGLWAQLEDRQDE